MSRHNVTILKDMYKYFYSMKEKILFPDKKREKCDVTR